MNSFFTLAFVHMHMLLQGMSSSPFKMLQVGMDYLFFGGVFCVCGNLTAVIPFDIEVNMHSFYNHISLYY